jgi:hypothetical protein
VQLIKTADGRYHNPEDNPGTHVDWVVHGPNERNLWEVRHGTYVVGTPYDTREEAAAVLDKLAEALAEHIYDLTETHEDEAAEPEEAEAEEEPG